MNAATSEHNESTYGWISSPLPPIVVDNPTDPRELEEVDQQILRLCGGGPELDYGILVEYGELLLWPAPVNNPA